MYVGPLQQHDAFLILFNIFHLFCFNTRTYKVGIKGKSILNLLKFGKIGYQTRMGNSDKAHDNMVRLWYLLIDIDSLQSIYFNAYDDPSKAELHMLLVLKWFALEVLLF